MPDTDRLPIERITIRILAYNPTESIDKEKILGRVDISLIAVAHIQIYHPVIAVGPDHGPVSDKDTSTCTSGLSFGRFFVTG